MQWISWPRAAVTAAALALLIALGSILPERTPEGRSFLVTLGLGAAFGIVLQRSRFCFFCIARDWIDHRDPGGVIAIVVALAVGCLGYAAIFGAWLPVPSVPRLPPDAHIGPVSWVLFAGAFAFGLGMALSGSCISAHLYRLGEGSPTAPFALAGAGIGFGLGFLSWNSLYLQAIQEAPVLWLPHWLGYGGTLGLQLGLLALIVLPVLRRPWPPRERSSPMLARILVERWPPSVGGLLVGFIAVIAYFRVGPLGVTAELGSIARTAADGVGVLPSRLEGLDGLAGCATAIKETLWSRNGVFVLALVLGSLLSAGLAGEFRPRWPRPGEMVRGVVGGILMGWGAMLALGCTVGVLLSGIMAGALSGWIFAATAFAGVWVGYKARQRAGLV